MTRVPPPAGEDARPVRLEVLPGDPGGGLTLAIHSDPAPDGRTYTRVRSYRLVPVRADFGRGFVLERPAADVEADRSDGQTCYLITVAPGVLRLCTCPVFAAARECDHLDALEAALAAGVFDPPGSTAPPAASPDAHT